MTRRRQKSVPSSAATSVVPPTDNRNTQSRTRTRLPLTRKLLFALVINVVLFGLLELILWAAAVAPAYHAEDPYAGFSRHIPHFVHDPQSDKPGMLTVAPSKQRVLNPQSFAAEKPEGVFRIVCLGGSTTYGRPFFDTTSFAGWLRALLPVADSARRFEVINAGGISYASYRALGVMEELAQYEPDMFIVYTGQNEFLERRTYGQLAEGDQLSADLFSLVSRTRTATVVRSAMDAAGLPRISASHREPVLGEETRSIPIDAVGPNAYRRDNAVRADVIRHFQATLTSMIHVAHRARAEILFVIPASNLADFSPFRSQHRDGLLPEDLRRWEQSMSAARSLMNDGNPAAAIEHVLQAETIDDQYAELWYLKGRMLRDLQRFDEAKQAFIRARDEDVCPLRAISPLVKVVRDVATEAGVATVDFEQLVDKHSEHELPGSAMFHDHVHLTIDANFRLALAIIRRLEEAGVLPSGATADEYSFQQIRSQVDAGLDRQKYARELRLLTAMLGWLNQTELALVQADLSLELSGRTEQALLELAKGLQANNASQLAISFLEQATQIAPDSATAHLRLGICCLDTGRLEQGISSLQKAIVLDAGLVEAHARLGVALAAQGDLTAAENHLTAAVHLDPGSEVNHNNLGLVLAKQGRLQEALEHYRRSLQCNPKFSSAHFNSGLALQQLGRTSDARLHFRETLLLVPDHQEARARLQELSP